MNRRLDLVTLIVLALAGCSGKQSVLDPAGENARNIASMWWLFLSVAALVYVVVIALLLGAVIRARRRERTPDPVIAPDPASERRLTRLVAGGAVLTGIVLAVLLVFDFIAAERLFGRRHEDHITIQVTGHQWWWEVEYLDPQPSLRVTTANELHLPVGKAVQFQLVAPDVIHSLWIPNLTGKRDLIPGRATRQRVRADSVGTFVGQCAEFCGYQHAHMRLTVTVETRAAFEKWIQNRRAAARAPMTTSQRRGQGVFMRSSCFMCHAVVGTGAGSNVGPDLTHVAARPTLGAGTLANTRANLALWIRDPSRFKPGVFMPPQPLRPGEMNDLLDYLQSLK